MKKNMDDCHGKKASNGGKGKMVTPGPINGNNGQTTMSSNWPKKKSK